MLQLGDIVGREIFMLNNLHKIRGVIILHFHSLCEIFLQLTVTIWTSTWSVSRFSLLPSIGRARYH